MSKNIVVKANILIEASYKLDLVEMRLILLAIIEARESKTLIDANSLIKISVTFIIGMKKRGNKFECKGNSNINAYGISRNSSRKILFQ